MAVQTTKKRTSNEKYLNAVFALIKKRDNLVITNKFSRFNDTELRLINEILLEKTKGKRLISTQIAKRLGVTRSAISQIVNRLETDGVVKRVPDDVDRKIAYIEIIDDSLKSYQKEIKECADYVGGAVAKYGVEKFHTMCDMVQEFIDCMKEERNNE